MPFENKILQLIKNVMPPNAEIHDVRGICLMNVNVSWKLDDDEERPNKRSKTISICVSHEAAQDFASASAANQEAAYQKVSRFLATKLAQFEPQHNTPKYEASPVEQWVISSAVMRG